MQSIVIEEGPLFLLTEASPEFQVERWTGTLDSLQLDAELIAQRQLRRRRCFIVQGAEWLSTSGLSAYCIESDCPIRLDPLPKDFASDVSIASGTWVGKVPFEAAVKTALEHESFASAWESCIAKWEGCDLWALLLRLLQADLANFVRPRRSFRLRLPWAGPLTQK